MWTIDGTHHIHVEPNASEQDVLSRATMAAQHATTESRVLVDLLFMKEIACACGQPANWHTYQVVLYALCDQSVPVQKASRKRKNV